MISFISAIISTKLIVIWLRVCGPTSIQIIHAEDVVPRLQQVGYGSSGCKSWCKYQCCKIITYTDVLYTICIHIHWGGGHAKLVAQCATNFDSILYLSQIRHLQSITSNCCKLRYRCDNKDMFWNSKISTLFMLY